MRIKKGNEQRYVIVNKETGEIIDDAQGYGYRTIQGAYKAFKFKNLSSSEKSERNKKINAVKKWCKANKGLVNLLLELDFEIYKGSLGEDEKFNVLFVTKVLEQNGIRIEDLNFTVKELIKYGL